MKIVELFEHKVLNENLSRGSINVLRNQNIVKGVADHLRNDITVDILTRNEFKKMSDQDVAEWFLKEVDRLSQQGYGGKKFNTNGEMNLWIANSYARRYDQWEDVTGVLPQTVTKFLWLKNVKNAPQDVLDNLGIDAEQNRKYGLLQPNHQDIQRFMGAKGLSRYLLQHYSGVLERHESKPDPERAAFDKSARMIKLADNKDYTLYFIQNRGAAIKFGKGALFCTGNTSPGNTNYNTYSSRAPLIGIQPKVPEEVTRNYGGSSQVAPEKYQFDAGDGPEGNTHYRHPASFKNVFDSDPNPELIKKKYPYLWYDLEKGMKEHREEIENPPVSENDPNYKVIKSETPGGPVSTPNGSNEHALVKAYNVDYELQKLKNNLKQFWTNEKRPAETAEEKPAEKAKEVEKPEVPKVVKPSIQGLRMARGMRFPK